MMNSIHKIGGRSINNNGLVVAEAPVKKPPKKCSVRVDNKITDTVILGEPGTKDMKVVSISHCHHATIRFQFPKKSEEAEKAGGVLLLRSNHPFQIGQQKAQGPIRDLDLGDAYIYQKVLEVKYLENGARVLVDAPVEVIPSMQKEQYFWFSTLFLPQ